MVAAYNAPADNRDLVASFNSLAEAQAYADEYGGEVEPIGVAFAVGRGADHARAKDDIAALTATQAMSPSAAAAVTSGPEFDAAVNAAVERALLARAGTTTPPDGGGDGSDDGSGGAS